MQIVAIANHKGGVGKTATAHALGATLARDYGRRVLLVDMDPQSSLTLACDIQAEGESLAEVLKDELLAADVVATIDEGLDLLPADIALAEAELLLAAKLGRENVLMRALAPLVGFYDIALIDCPPSLGLLTVNALRAAQAVLIPTQAQVADLRGLRLFLGTLQKVREAINPELQTLGILATFYDERLLHHQSGMRAMEAAGLPLLPVAIGRTVRIAEAAAEHESVVTYEPANRQAAAYRELGGYVDQWLRSGKVA